MLSDDTPPARSSSSTARQSVSEASARFIFFNAPSLLTRTRQHLRMLFRPCLVPIRITVIARFLVDGAHETCAQPRGDVSRLNSC